MAQEVMRIYQQCDPAKPLPSGDPRYISFDDVRGHGDPVRSMEFRIRFSDSALHLAFAGHRGGGKTTDLLRLQHDLETPSPEGDRYFIVYFEVDKEDIDINDAEFSDILLAMVRQTAKALRERLQVSVSPSWLQSFINGLKVFFGAEVEPEKLELDFKIAKLTAAIKNSPSARDEIRKAIEPHNMTNLLTAANEILDTALIHLRTRGYRDLVIIVDNLDRLVLRPIQNSQYNTQENLFINRAGQLTALNCHVIYTVPLSLIYSPLGSKLGDLFGTSPIVQPMVKVSDSNGLEKMRLMLEKRIEQAGVIQPSEP